MCQPIESLNYHQLPLCPLMVFFNCPLIRHDHHGYLPSDRNAPSTIGDPFTRGRSQAKEICVPSEIPLNNWGQASIGSAGIRFPQKYIYRVRCHFWVSILPSFRQSYVRSNISLGINFQENEAKKLSFNSDLIMRRGVLHLFGETKVFEFPKSLSKDGRISGALLISRQNTSLTPSISTPTVNAFECVSNKLH